MVLKTGALAQQGGFSNPTNLLFNGDFEDWVAGTAVAPTNWAIEGAGMAVAREASTVKIGTYSAKLTGPAGGGWISQQLQNSTDKPIAYWQGRTITVGCWIWSATASRVGLYITDGVAAGLSSYHPGDSAWHWLTLTYTVNVAASYVKINCLIDSGSGSVIGYFDGVICVEGTTVPAFAPKGTNYYDEGVYTPVIAFGGASVGVTYGQQAGKFTRIGNRVFVSIYIVLTSKGSSTGDVEITLPFVVNDATYPPISIMARYITLTANYTQFTGYAEHTVAWMALEQIKPTDGSLTTIKDTNFSGIDQLFITLNYTI